MGLEKKIDLSMWSSSLQVQIRKTLKMGEELMKKIKFKEKYLNEK